MHMCAYAFICSTTYPPEVFKLKPTTLYDRQKPISFFESAPQN